MHQLTAGGSSVFACVTAQDVSWGKSHVHPEVAHEVKVQLQRNGAVMTQWSYMQRTNEQM